MAFIAVTAKERMVNMSEQSTEKIIEAVEEYGVPLLKLYTVMTVIGAVIFLVFFVAIFIIILKRWHDMDKHFDDFRK